MSTKPGDGRSVINEEQWEMPVSFDSAGRPVSLHDYAKGDLPKDVTSLDRVELFCDRTTGIPGLEFEKKGAFSGKKAEIRPLVLKNVTVERPKK